MAFDEAAVEKFTELRRNGVRIGSVDLKIASIALVQNATVLTTKLRDFQQVPDLVVGGWLGELE